MSSDWRKGLGSDTPMTLNLSPSRTLRKTSRFSIIEATSSPSLPHSLSEFNMSLGSSAVEGPDVVAVFQQWEDLKKLEKEKKFDKIFKDKEKDSQQIFWVSQMDRIISDLENIRLRTMPPSWGAVFNKRTEKSRIALTYEKALHFQHVLVCHVNLLSEYAKDHAAKLKIVEALLEHVNTHMCDIDNLLIGQSPSEEIMGLLRTHFVIDNPLEKKKDQVLLHVPSYLQLVTKLVEWGQSLDQNHVQDEIQRMCAAYRGVDRMERGDIAAVMLSSEARITGTTLANNEPLMMKGNHMSLMNGAHEDSSNMAYGRFTGIRRNDNEEIEFFMSPDESRREFIKRRDVYPLTPHTKEMAKDKKTINKLVRDPAEGFYKMLKDHIRESTEEFLIQKHNVHAETMKRVGNGQVSIRDIRAVNHAVRVLLDLVDNPPEKFFKEMTFYIRALVSIQTRKLTTDARESAAVIRRDQTIAALKTFSHAPLAEAQLKAWLGLFHSAQNDILVLCRSILGGHKKRQMTDWWLEKIESSAHHFLCQLGYDFDAIPANYIQEAPQSLEVVRENFKIMEDVMNCKDTANYQPLINSLKAEIYPVIDDFIEKAFIVFLNQLDMTLRDKSIADSQQYSIEELEQAFRERQTGFDRALADQLRQLLQDLKYLLTMKRMETDPDEKNFHILPIRNLVLNHFLRQWNEVKTVMDIWCQPKKGERTILHTKVNEADVDGIHKILSTPDASMLINMKDPDGWTPLHCACHLGVMDICLLLLKQDKISVNFKNKDENTALHYIVRHNDSVPVIKLLKLKGADLDAQNRHKETPLHTAASRGKTEAVAYLLDNGADPNSANVEGDTSLHYAVFCGSKEIVELLLKAGAKVDVSSKKQGTPLEVATKCNLVDIAQLLKAAPTPVTATANTTT